MATYDENGDVLVPDDAEATQEPSSDTASAPPAYDWGSTPQFTVTGGTGAPMIGLFFLIGALYFLLRDEHEKR